MDLLEFRNLLLAFVDKLKLVIEKNNYHVNVADLPWNDLKDNLFKYMDLSSGTLDEESCEKNKQRLTKMFEPLEIGLYDGKRCCEFLDWITLVINMQPRKDQVDLLETCTLIKPLIQNIGLIMNELSSLRWMKYLYQDTESEEISEYIQMLEEIEEIDVVNFEGKNKYNHMEISIIFDENYGLHYSLYHGKKMYFPEEWSESEIDLYLRGILCEQDAASPHSYNTDFWRVEEGDIILDIGAAEGNYSLEHVEKAGHIYIAEPEEIWEKPLRATFAKYLDKITFINKFVGEVTDDNCISIDDLIGATKVDVIKMDIEGAEASALAGAKKTLQNNQVKCAICTYHRKNDGEEFEKLFDKLNYKSKFSRGFMAPAWIFSFWDVRSFLDGDLRRGVIFAKKEDENDLGRERK